MKRSFSFGEGFRKGPKLHHCLSVEERLKSPFPSVKDLGWGLYRRIVLISIK
jgi:hypothetical protein